MGLFNFGKKRNVPSLKPKPHFSPTLGKITDRPLNSRKMWDRMQRLDLSSVEEKLSEKGWDRNRIKKNIIEYKKFLYLFGTELNDFVPWDDDVDEVWHTHILQMKKYETDCKMLFNELLYHDPSVKRGTQNHDEGVERTSRSYNKVFVPPPLNMSTSAAYSNYCDHNSWVPWAIYAAILLESNSSAPCSTSSNSSPCSSSSSTPSCSSHPSSSCSSSSSSCSSSSSSCSSSSSSSSCSSSSSSCSSSSSSCGSSS